MPKEKILSLPSEYITIGLAAFFVISVFIGILFISSRTSSGTIASSIPLASGEGVLSNPGGTANEVPKTLASQPPAGPITPSTKPKATPILTPKPSTTSTPTPTTSASPTDTPSPTSTPTAEPQKVINLTMDPSSVTDKHVNDTFTLDLKIDTSSDHAIGAELHLSYDHTKLEAQSFTAGNFMTQVLVNGKYDNTAGTASITVGSGLNPVQGSGTLGTITFKALATGSSDVNYTDDTKVTSTEHDGNRLNNKSGSSITIN